MKTSSSAKLQAHTFSQAQCFLAFCIMFPVILAANHILLSAYRPAFHVGLLASGWCAWTFFEYIAHRFWMHAHGTDKRDRYKHTHHHQHPTEIAITPVHRIFFIAACVALVAASWWLDNYFTLLAGLFIGFVGYTFMHVWLHQRWTQQFFPRLHRNHVHHHCKHPDKCFGVCVTWWDHLFGTTPQEAVISPRIIDFYFGQRTQRD